jgi:hypothetical protein
MSTNGYMHVKRYALDVAVTAEIGEVARRPEVAPSGKRVLETPARRGRVGAVLDLERVAELAEGATAGARLDALPVPQVVAKRAGDV